MPFNKQCDIKENICKSDGPDNQCTYKPLSYLTYLYLQKKQCISKTFPTSPSSNISPGWEWDHNKKQQAHFQNFSNFSCWNLFPPIFPQVESEIAGAPNWRRVPGFPIYATGGCHGIWYWDTMYPSWHLILRYIQADINVPAMESDIEIQCIGYMPADINVILRYMPADIEIHASWHQCLCFFFQANHWRTMLANALKQRWRSMTSKRMSFGSVLGDSSMIFDISFIFSLWLF